MNISSVDRVERCRIVSIGLAISMHAYSSSGSSNGKNKNRFVSILLHPSVLLVDVQENQLTSDVECTLIANKSCAPMMSVIIECLNWFHFRLVLPCFCLFQYAKIPVGTTTRVIFFFRCFLFASFAKVSSGRRWRWCEQWKIRCAPFSHDCFAFAG